MYTLAQNGVYNIQNGALVLSLFRELKVPVSFTKIAWKGLVRTFKKYINNITSTPIYYPFMGIPTNNHN